MILTIYAMKNRLTGIFEKPFAEGVDVKDYPEALTQALSLADPVALERHKEFDVYCLGSFDTKTAEIKSCVDFVMSLEQVCLSLLEKKNVRENRESEQEVA